MKVNVEMNEVQLQVVMKALNLYSRLKMAQFEELRWELNPFAPADEMRKLSSELKQLIYPDLDKGVYYGIFMEEVGDGKVAYDIYASLRHDYSWFKNPEGSYTIEFDRPLHVSKEPLPNIKIEE